jgi:phage terminase large subunit GpA-like protein
MDASSEPQTETVVVMSSAQVGKTELVNNSCGYYVASDPCPILVINPTLDMAEAWSKDRLGPMLRDSPILQGLVKDARSRDSGNTVLHKSFPGGHITMAGANSPASLASRPIRVVIADEVDRYPASAGTEGDPVSLAVKRTTTFWNRKIILVSTPTIKGASRIEQAFEQSDQRRYFVSCPHCQHEQVLRWSNVKWDVGEPEKAWYECESCQKPITNAHKAQMIRMGKWKATAPFKGVAGFHLNELYSPWRTFGDVAAAFVKAKDNPQQLQTWVNTSLGETWEEEAGEQLGHEALMARAEPYQPLTVPIKGLLLTSGVDVQNDRLVFVLRAWGRGEESWLVYWQELWGDPTTEEPWKQLDELLAATYTHESGAELKIDCTAIDSGFLTSEVYNYVRTRSDRFRAIAIKGQSTEGKPIIGKPSHQDVDYKGKTVKQGVQLWPVGSDTCKHLIYGRLRQKEIGPGYYHFPIGIDAQYYLELTAEKLLTKFNKGFPKREWTKLPGRRNEALDCECYALAAAVSCGIHNQRWDWRKLETRVKPDSEQNDDSDSEPHQQSSPAKTQHAPKPLNTPRPRRERDNWATRW